MSGTLKFYQAKYLTSIKMENTEIWRPVIGFEKFYEVSSLGRVRGLRRSTRKSKTIPAFKILAPRINRGGYVQHGLSEKGKSKNHRAHRLVAVAFVDNPFNYTYVNHKDGNKTNNAADNLEWVTPSGNNKHAYDSGLRIVTDKQRTKFLENLKSSIAHKCKIVLNLEYGIYYSSLKEAAELNGINRRKMQSSLSGSTKNKTNFIYV